MGFVKKYFSHLFILLLLINGSCTIFAQNQSKIFIESNEMQINRDLDPDLTKFIGNVFVTHENMKMYCDSAYQFEIKNIVEAFGNVHAIQGDTIHMYGDYLHYDGNIRLAEVRNNVKLRDPSIILTTQFLNFDLNESVGYYTNGGKIVDSANVLTSNIGRYYTKDQMFFFKDSVEVKTTDYILYSDTLKYDTKNHTSYILGPTRIQGEDETLYSEDGWYNSQSNISQFVKNTRLESKEYSVRGDSIYLDRNNKIGKLFQNIELQDTLNNLIIWGHYLESFQKTEEALITDSIIFVQISKDDSLFLHADTLRIEKDSADFKRILAYHHVKFFRKNLQGKCDSMVYSLRDSTIRLFSSPILWVQGNQITADSISIEIHNRKAKFIHFDGSAFLCSKEDNTKYNQIKGKSMLGFMHENRLYRLDIFGNGETLYFPKDKDEIIGMNIAKSSNISIRLKNNQIDQIIFIKKPEGNLFPLGEIQFQKMFLKDFRWLEDYRPKSKQDILFWGINRKNFDHIKKNNKKMELKKLHDVNIHLH